MRPGAHAAAIAERHAHGRLNARFRERSASREDQVLEDGLADPKESTYQQVFRTLRAEFLKEMNALTSGLFVEYEEKLMSVLQTAMQDTSLNASLNASSASAASLAYKEATNPGLELLQTDFGSPARSPSWSPAQAPPQSVPEAAPREGLNASQGSGSDGCEDLKRKRAGVLAMDAHQYALDNLDEKVYHVENYYKTSGSAQAIARSEWFGNLTMFIIAANAIYLGIDADYNKEDLLVDAGWGWILAENVFCLFFTIEIVIRFMAFEHKRHCLVDGWFRFDACLVALMILEVWGMLLLAGAGARLSGLPTAPLRLLRLLRLSRMVRFMRNMPELVTMVKGMRTASRAVASSCVMVLLLVYVFSIVMKMLLEPVYNNVGLPDNPYYEHREFILESFGGLAYCMWTLLMDGSFMLDAGIVMLHLRNANHWMGYVAVFVFLSFMLLSALMVLNMLIGILCEVVTAVGQAERDEADIRLVKLGILSELLKFDADNSGTISQKELETVMRSKRAQSVLEDLEVDQASLETIQGMLFKNPGDEISIRTILETCLNYRGRQPPTVKHLVDAMIFNRHFMEKMFQEEIHALSCTMTRRFIALQQDIQSRAGSGPEALPADLVQPSTNTSPRDSSILVPGRTAL